MPFKSELEQWKEGVSLHLDSGQSIDNLMLRVALARWKLAAEHRRDANQLMRQSRVPYRSAISRYYYAMYHAMRAAAYVFHGGDDHESHSLLPSNVPGDFPNASLWRNELKDARLTRNAADYDPYPRSRNYWYARARTMKRRANRLVRETRAYLRGKGCGGI